MEKQRLFSKLISTSADDETDEEKFKDVKAWKYNRAGQALKYVERDL